MLTKLTNMISKINYALYGVKLNAQSFAYCDTAQNHARHQSSSASVYQHHDLADLLLHFCLLYTSDAADE